MDPYIRFFFGTPRRFLATLIGIGLIICMIDPDILKKGLIGLVSAITESIGPLLGPVIMLLIVFAGIKLILSGKK